MTAPRLRRVLRRLSVCALAIVAPTAADAFTCSGSSGPFSVVAEVVFARGAPGAVARVGGSIAVKTRDIPADLVKLDLDAGALVHHWQDGEQLNLYFVKDRASGQPAGSVEVIITTRRGAKDEDGYRGRFRLKVSYLKKSGDATPVEFMSTGGATCTGTGT